MPSELSFFDRLRAIVVPTTGQTLGAVFLSLLLLTVTQSQSLLQRLGITPAVISATQDQFQLHFGAILRSEAASHIALITFWATIGLVTYLICWGFYNILIEARNEITLSTRYTNRTNYTGKHWRSATETLALKAVAGTGLAALLGSLWYGVSFWLALTAGAIDHLSIITAITALLAVVGFALHLYLAFAFILLTFTPWYRSEAFTER